jgi:Uma2 family endonuclease
MIQAISKSQNDQIADQKYFSLSEFYAYCDRSEIQYELEDGELVAMPSEPIANSVLSRRLFMALAQYVPLDFLTYKEVFVEVTGRRVRVPDLLVLGDECHNALQSRNNGTISQEMPSPLIAIEIVSPRSGNIARDYRYKRSEYAARGIREYWIVDPEQKKITILSLVEGFYEEIIYAQDQQLISPALPEIKIKVSDIL